ncbi:hypothetical protein AGRA3207_005181 [Actinomadura graeca]|uniref:DUF4352 domain-containing protein n=1 Tax=Actinomadura graeca TaxID=2750812 RepID=A0ABX8R1V1_9ACTN|nr:hypothetical protein [Actinomadura graeca]QXJ23947.1 hypothetical protein AGRA3207_005181 [Actinomadura graeca]
MNVRRLLTQGGAGIGGTVLLAGAMWLHSIEPKVEAGELDPIRGSGRIGQDVGNHEFVVRVERVEAARSLAPSLSLGDPPPIGSDGVYLVVRLRATTRRAPLKLTSAELETPGGPSYRAGPRTGAGDVVQPEFQPMIWTPTVFVFELPRERVAGAHLVVGTGGLLPQLSAAADIDLGLTGARAAELIRTASDRYDVRARP